MPTDTTPAADYPASPRRDGWDGVRKAWFLEELAETGVVTRALEAVGRGLSGVYAVRARDPVFATAWDAARLIVREQLFDTLIGQAFEGEVHVTLKEGNETQRRRRNYRLGLGMLDRLNAFCPGPLAGLFAQHFEAVCAMIEDEAEAPAWRAWLAGIDHEIEIETIRELFPLADESAENPNEFAVWDFKQGDPRTNLPPPPGFYGIEYGRFGEEEYDRTLTAEERAHHYANAAERGGSADADPLAEKRARGEAVWAAWFGDDEADSADGADGDAEDDDGADADLDAIEVKSLGGMRRHHVPHPVSRFAPRTARHTSASPAALPQPRPLSACVKVREVPCDGCRPGVSA